MLSTETRGRMLDAGQVAERLSISKPTVYRLIHDRSLPAVQFGTGGSLRIPERALDTWIEDHRIIEEKGHAR
jgi:excisionase family DNA binding protein